MRPTFAAGLPIVAIPYNDMQPALVSVYGWFTEGFDTADLQEARTLLEELT